MNEPAIKKPVRSMCRQVARPAALALVVGACLSIRAGAARGPAAVGEVVRVSTPEARNPAEPSVAIDPTNPDHVVAVSFQAGGPTGPRGSDYAYASRDGGRTWRTAPAPNPARRGQGDDAVTFAPDGIALHAYISFEGIRVARPQRASTGIFVCASRDGLTWAEPVPVVDHVNCVTPFEDKPFLKVDTSPESPHRGAVYVAWTRFDVYGSKVPADKSHVYVSRSSDGARTFSVPLRISDTPGDCQDSSNTVMGAVPVVGPRGEVYVTWGGPRGLVFDRSTDGGATFGEDRVVSETPGGWDFSVPGPGRANGLPVPAVDLSSGPNRGSVYVNWIDARNGDPDVFVAASRDGGTTWGAPVRVNDDPKGNGTAQFFTWMAVDPADGALNVFFYDRRDLDGTQTRLTLARSVDCGRTFVNYAVPQPPFSFASPAFFGDYTAIDALGGRIVAVYPHFDEKQLVLSAALFRFKPGTQELASEW